MDLHTPPYHTGPLPALRLSPLPISTGSQLDHYAYGFETNFIRAPYENTHRLEYYPVAVARASLSVNGGR